MLSELLGAIDLACLADRVASARTALVDQLRLHEFDVDVADGPWVLVHGVPTLRDDLARHGVVVRDCTSFGLTGTVRIAVPDRVGLRRLAEAIERTIHPQDP